MAYRAWIGGWVVACGAAIAACGGGTEGDSVDASSPGNDDGGPGDVQVDSADAPVADAGDATTGCTPFDAGPFGYLNAAGGTVSGSGGTATICNAEAYLFESHYTTPPNDYLLFLNSAEAATITFQSPATASSGLLVGSMMISAPAPGVYPSAGACGFLGFSYSLPVPPGVDCGDATPTTGPSCPPGCSTVCSGQGCEPCTPSQPEVDFNAAGVSDCLGNATTVAGSWTVTLTSVEPYTGMPATIGNPDFIVHGSVTATLPAGDNATGSVTLTMGF